MRSSSLRRKRLAAIEKRREAEINQGNEEVRPVKRRLLSIKAKTFMKYYKRRQIREKVEEQTGRLRDRKRQSRSEERSLPELQEGKKSKAQSSSAFLSGKSPAHLKAVRGARDSSKKAAKRSSSSSSSSSSSAKLYRVKEYKECTPFYVLASFRVRDKPLQLEDKKSPLRVCLPKNGTVNQFIASLPLRSFTRAMIRRNLTYKAGKTRYFGFRGGIDEIPVQNELMFLTICSKNLNKMAKSSIPHIDILRARTVAQRAPDVVSGYALTNLRTPDIRLVGSFIPESEGLRRLMLYQPEQLEMKDVGGEVRSADLATTRFLLLKDIKLYERRTIEVQKAFKTSKHRFPANGFKLQQSSTLSKAPLSVSTRSRGVEKPSSPRKLRRTQRNKVEISHAPRRTTRIPRIVSSLLVTENEQQNARKRTRR